MTTSSDPTETAVIGGDSTSHMTPRAAFIYGYCIASSGALQAAGFRAADVASVGSKIRENAIEAWDYLNESEVALAARLAGDR